MSIQPGAFVRSILEPFGSYARTAEIMKTPESTVHFWSRNGNIPHWRRGDVLKAARKRKIELTEQQLAYLQGKESAKDFLKAIGREITCSGMNGNQPQFTLAALPHSKEL